MPDATVVIPTYKESENVVPITQAVQSALSDAGIGHEILIVDDDSPDGTWRIARKRFSDDRHVHVIRRTSNPGLGEAVERGFRAASGEIVAVMDADFQHPPTSLPALITAFNDDTDVVIGSRFIDGGGIEGWPRHRHLISWGGRMLARLALDRTWKLTDPMSGFFAVRRSLVEEIDLDPEGYKILLEVIRRTKPSRVGEVPYRFRERRAGESNLDARETARFVWHMVSLSLEDVSYTRSAVVASALLLLSARPTSLQIAVGIAVLLFAGLLLEHTTEVRRRLRDFTVSQNEVSG